MVPLNCPLRLRFSSHIKSAKSLTRSIIAFTSVIPGNIGDTKHTVRIPASYTFLIAANLRSILTARSISLRNCSSKVFIDHETVTFGNFLSKSRSRKTKSDLVHIIISAFVPFSSSRSLRVLQNSSSYGLYPSVTEPITIL